MMNRYLAEGMVRDLISGRRVLWVGRRPHDHFEEFLDLDVLPAAAQVRRARGAEEITLGHGSIRFMAATTPRVRGRSADVAVVCGVPDPEVCQAVMASGAEVVRS